MVQFKVTNIVWDTDGEDVSLPNETVINAYDENDIADSLSDYYGWCVLEFDYERID